MENKLEFLNSPVVPLYNWEQWDTKRDNWNYYKQYPISPTKDWKYKVWNVDNDVIHYGYKQTNASYTSPLFEMKSITYEETERDRRSIVPFIYGRDDGAWMYDIEESFKRYYPSEQVIPAEFANKMICKKPKDRTLTLYSDMESIAKSGNAAGLFKLDKFINKPTNGLMLYGKNDYYHYRDAYEDLKVGVEVFTTNTYDDGDGANCFLYKFENNNHKGKLYGITVRNKLYTLNVKADLFFKQNNNITTFSHYLLHVELDQFIGYLNVTSRWDEERQYHTTSIHPYMYSNWNSRTVAMPIVVFGHNIDTLAHNGFTIKDKYISIEQSPTETPNYINYNDCTEGQKAAIDAVVPYDLPLNINESELETSHKTVIVDAQYTADDETNTKFTQINYELWDKKPKYKFDRHYYYIQSSSPYNNIEVTRLAEAGYHNYDSYNTYSVQKNSNGEFIIGDYLINKRKLVGYTRYTDWDANITTRQRTKLNWQDGIIVDDGSLIKNTASVVRMKNEDEQTYQQQLYTDQNTVTNNSVQQNPDKLNLVNRSQEIFLFTPSTTIGKKTFSTHCPNYIDYYVDNVCLCNELQYKKSVTTPITPSPYYTNPIVPKSFNKWADLGTYKYLQAVTPEGYQPRQSLFPLYDGTPEVESNLMGPYVDGCGGIKYYSYRWGPRVYVFDRTTDTIPTIDNFNQWTSAKIKESENVISAQMNEGDNGFYSDRYGLYYNNLLTLVDDYFDKYIPVTKDDRGISQFYDGMWLGTYKRFDYDVYGNRTLTQGGRVGSFAKYHQAYMNLHSSITPKPLAPTGYNPQNILITNVQIKDGYFRYRYSYEFERDPQRDYIEPGAQKGSHYYGEIDYYKVANINRQDQLYKDYYYLHTKDGLFEDDYGTVAKMLIPAAWLSDAQFLPVSRPVDGRHTTEVEDVDGSQVPVPISIWVELQTETVHAAQPYQPTTAQLLGTVHYTEAPHVPELPHNYSRPNTAFDKWEVWDYAHYGGHPTTFIKYVESQNVNAYPSPNNPEYDPTTHTWTDGYQNGYWYWRKADTTTHQKTLYDKDLRDGVKLEHNINSASDFVFGTAAAASIQFNYYSTVDNASQYLNEPCAYYTKYGTNPYAIKGVFTVTDMNTKRNYTSFSGYDNMIFTDISASSFISGTTFPITAKQMFQNLCFYCDLTYDANCIQDTDSTQAATYFPSASHLIYNNFTSANITARQVFSYLGEVLNCFFAISTSGKIYPGKYITTNFALDNEDYVEYTFSKYTVNGISKVIIKADSSYGFVEGNDNGDTYFINNNPLLYAEQKTEVQDVLTNTLAALSNISYKPGTVKTLNDIGINVGDKITVDNNTFYVMKKTVTNSGTTYECLGNQNRQTGYDTQDTNIIALRGITQNLNDLTQTLDVDLTSIDTRFANITGRVSTLAGQTEGNSREIDDLQTLTASHTSTLSNHGGRITSLEGRMTTAEGNITSNTTSIGSINNTLSNHETRISANTWKADQNAQNIATNTTDISILKDLRPIHMGAVNNGYGTFISPTGIYYCLVNANKAPTSIVYYINWTNGKTNLAITTDAWSGNIPSDIIW